MVTEKFNEHNFNYLVTIFNLIPILVVILNSASRLGDTIGTVKDAGILKIYVILKNAENNHFSSVIENTNLEPYRS